MLNKIDYIIENIKTYDPKVNSELINEAFNFSKKAHSKQKRVSGDPFFEHPIQVARLLSEIKLDGSAIVAGLLHDTVEDTNINIKEINNKFGSEISYLVDGLTKIEQISLKKNSKTSSENFRKLLLATTQDIRVILIKLADRLHNMRTLHYFKDNNKKYKIAYETQEIYAPLAQRLGIREWQDELEDLSFSIINPDIRKSIIERLNYLNKKDESIIDDISQNINNLLKKEDLNSNIIGRLKTPFSIWLKIKRKDISFEQLSDIMAFRIIVNSTRSCYNALGVIHRNFKMIPGRFKDFVSIPKSNGYRSIHTTVIGPKNKKIEIQIRSKAMQEISEYGVAAHWKYKNPKDVKEKDKKEYQWLHDLVEIIEQANKPEEIIKDTKMQLFRNNVYAFSPKGDIYELPANSTPIDFAYTIHSDIGDTCIGAKINGRLQPLKIKINNGDQVEIITSKNSSPSPLWERFAVTNRVKTRIRKFVRSQKKDEYLKLGKQILLTTFKTENLSLNEKVNKEILNKLKCKNIDDVYELVGSGTFTVTSIIKSIYPEFKFQNNKINTSKNINLIKLKGLTPGMAYHLSGCCSPIIGDQIVGIVTAGKGVSVHTIDCEMLNSFSEMPDRWLNLSWENDQKNTNMQVSRIKVIILNKPGSLGVISTIIAKNNGNISNISFDNRSKDFYELSIDIEIRDKNHLNNIIAALRLEPVSTLVKRIKGYE